MSVATDPARLGFPLVGGRKHDATRSFIFPRCVLCTVIRARAAGARIDVAVTRPDREKSVQDRVVYYGAPVGKAEILRQKQEVGARLRGHSYHLVPGTARSSCDPSGDRCHLTGVLEWRAGHGSGSATLALDLARIDGVLKVVREGGNVIARGRCGATGCGYHLPSLR